MDKINEPKYGDVSDTDKALLLAWIRENFAPADRAYEYSSYGIKHYFEGWSGIYIENGQMKAAMLECGYQPIDESETNWWFRAKWVRPCHATTAQGLPCKSRQEEPHTGCGRHYSIGREVQERELSAA